MGIFDKFKKNKVNLSEEVLQSLDPSIIPLITLLNEKGVQTFACCSGYGDEHEHPEEVTTGYVAFQESKQARKLIANLLDVPWISKMISSSPLEPYEYFGQEISKERLGLYFSNYSGRNMEVVYDRVKGALERRVNRKNLNIVNSVINKFRDQKGEFDWSVDFHFDRDEQSNCIVVDLNDMYLLDDKINVGQPQLLLQDIAKSLEGDSSLAYCGRIIFDNLEAKKVPEVVELTKRRALTNRDKYITSRESARKPYDDGDYVEQEPFYCIDNQYTGVPESCQEIEGYIDENSLEEGFPLE